MFIEDTILQNKYKTNNSLKYINIIVIENNVRLIFYIKNFSLVHPPLKVSPLFTVAADGNIFIEDIIHIIYVDKYKLPSIELSSATTVNKKKK